MHIDLLEEDSDYAEKRHWRSTFRLRDAEGLRKLDLELPAMPGDLPDWVTSVRIPPDASAQQRAGVLDRLRGYRQLHTLSLTFSSWETANREVAQLASLQQISALLIDAPPGSGEDEFDAAVDIRPLSELRRLRSLHLFGPIRDIAALVGLSDLRELEVSHYGRDFRMPKFRPVPERTGSISLPEDFSSTGRVPVRHGLDVAVLRELRTLRKLTLNCVSDIGPIDSLHQLEDLCLDYSDVANLEPLRNLRNLRHLSLHETLVSDLWPIAGLDALRELYLGRTDVRDIRPLAACAGLERVALHDCPVADISPLQSCSRLEQLSLRDGHFCGIEYLTFTNSLPNLQAVWLDGELLDPRLSRQDAAPLAEIRHGTGRRADG